eukprot:3595402-Amphidinium_carterae.1
MPDGPVGFGARPDGTDACRNCRADNLSEPAAQLVSRAHKTDSAFPTFRRATLSLMLQGGKGSMKRTVVSAKTGSGKDPALRPLGSQPLGVLASEVLAS